MKNKDHIVESTKMVTAVEWLVQELNQKIDFIPMDKWDMIRDIVQQAKQMEKEQIIQAITNTIIGSNVIYVYGNEHPEVIHTAEQYYNETYGK